MARTYSIINTRHQEEDQTTPGGRTALCSDQRGTAPLEMKVNSPPTLKPFPGFFRIQSGCSISMLQSSADMSATQSELISWVTAVQAAHGKIARHLHTAARPPGHERESTELLIRTLPAHPAGPPHPRTQSLNCCGSTDYNNAAFK
ncbi:unnamed protein product [Pleuronectes platessa]|uniref:PH domain-containing protein n=1 Tax=Pleuronectes platessa TaxID=8262 RepID=A0A9N7URL6_PLEPL|nr:unnamed protein product [Pleuronectes platessa]